MLSSFYSQERCQSIRKTIVRLQSWRRDSNPHCQFGKNRCAASYTTPTLLEKYLGDVGIRLLLQLKGVDTSLEWKTNSNGIQPES